MGSEYHGGAGGRTYSAQLYIRMYYQDIYVYVYDAYNVYRDAFKARNSCVLGPFSTKPPNGARRTAGLPGQAVKAAHAVAESLLNRLWS